MATLTTRASKGSPLTHTEVDDNFINLNTELSTKVDEAGARASISVTGDLTYDSGTGVLGVNVPVTSVAGRTGDVLLTSSDVGLGNVANVDTTNAANISSGTLPSGRLSGSYGISITGNAATATTATNQSGGTVSATTGTFSSTLTLSADTADVLNFSSNSTNDARGIAFNARTALSADYNDGWLRLNQLSEFSNGVYTPGSLRADGGLQAGDGSLATPGFRFQADPNNGMYRYGTDIVGFSAGGNDEFRIYTSYTLSPGSSRAPIFYDSNNTGYYADPASTSVFNATRHLSIVAGSTSAMTSGGQIAVFAADPYISFHDGSSATRDGYFQKVNATDRFLLAEVGYTESTGSFRAPLFYDSNNTAYYFDGSSTGASIRVAGSITAYYSDERLKDIIGPIEGALDKVNQLDGFYYTPNKTAQRLGYKNKIEVGVSAQAVERVLPEIVTAAPISSEYKTIDYARLTPLLIEAVKELNQRVDTIEEQVCR